LALALTEGQHTPSNELREDVIELLWMANKESEEDFTAAELDISVKEAKAKYDVDTFRQWKRARKKIE
jgi:hypothetical protein